LPSLHAVMAALVVLHCRPLLSREGLVVLAVWWGLLLCSTLATGQHRLLDLAAGTVLALGVYLIFSGSGGGWRGRLLAATGVRGLAFKRMIRP